MYTEGGIYMDTDVEVLGSLNDFLFHPAFSGFEEKEYVPTGIMAAQQKSIWIRELLAYYESRPFILEDGILDMTTNTKSITDYMLTKGLRLNDQYQEFDDLVAIYPHDYFCPKDHKTGIITLTPRSVCIHHFAMSWVDPRKKRLTILKKFLISMIGGKAVYSLIESLKLKKLKQKIIK
jgi:hypothetical protein